MLIMQQARALRAETYRKRREKKSSDGKRGTRKMKIVENRSLDLAVGANNLDRLIAELRKQGASEEVIARVEALK